jgi:hypothetical protein
MNTDHNRDFDINKFHEMLSKFQKTADIHDFKLMGKSKICEDCALAKAR